MLIWTLALIVTLAVLTALYYAGERDKVNVDTSDARAAARAHYRAQLDEITNDIDAGRYTPDEAEAAKGELAREVMRLQSTNHDSKPAISGGSFIVRFSALAVICVFTFGIYSQLGNPQLPAQPLSTRAQPQIDTSQINVADAIARVEAQLAQNPEDVRGWTVLGPIYMRQNRFEEAANAFRQVLALAPATADAETNLAEAVMMLNNGIAQGEPLALLESAAARDPGHVRSRFYLAGEATRTGDFAQAIEQWQALLALAQGDESWVEVARNGLATAQAGLSGDTTAPPQTDSDQSAQIAAMVEGLAIRLADGGGSVDEWTRLVRSYLVLGQTGNAQAAYESALEAYPDAADRGALDALAQQAGLISQ